MPLLTVVAFASEANAANTVVALDAGLRLLPDTSSHCDSAVPFSPTSVTRGRLVLPVDQVVADGIDLRAGLVVRRRAFAAPTREGGSGGSSDDEREQELFHFFTQARLQADLKQG